MAKWIITYKVTAADLSDVMRDDVCSASSCKKAKEVAEEDFREELHHPGNEPVVTSAWLKSSQPGLVSKVRIWKDGTVGTYVIKKQEEEQDGIVHKEGKAGSLEQIEDRKKSLG